MLRREHKETLWDICEVPASYIKLIIMDFFGGMSMQWDISKREVFFKAMNVLLLKAILRYNREAKCCMC